MASQKKQIVIGVTGASGAVYAHRLVGCLLEADADVHLIVTPHGQRLFVDELDLKEITASSFPTSRPDGLHIYNYRDVGAKLGSGSFLTDGMIICPCSSNTLASVASGLANNLLDRTAAVTLKERRRLILVPREMPAGHIDLQNALRLSEAGAIICPAAPGFYMLPRTIDDLVDFVVGKLMDLVGVGHRLNTRWTGDLPKRVDPIAGSQAP